MHEVGLIHEVLLIAKEVAEKEGLSRVTTIKLIIGEKLCVMPESLEFAFQYLRSGEILEHAELDWEFCSGTDFYITYIEGD